MGCFEAAFWGILEHFGQYFGKALYGVSGCSKRGCLGAFKVFFNALFGVLEHFRVAFWSFRTFWGVSEEHFGVFQGSVLRCFGAFQRVLALRGSVLGQHLGVFLRLWGHFGMFWGISGSSFGASGEMLGPLQWPFWGYFDGNI